MDQNKYLDYKEKLSKLNQQIKDNPKEIENLADEYNEAITFVNDFEEISRLNTQIENNLTIKDPELLNIIKDENKNLEKRIYQIKNKYNPSNINDSKNIILEIRAGTGGDEAGLFVKDMYEVYKKYIESKGWKLNILDISYNESSGIKQIIASVKGNMVYGNFKFESGVHRVQRVPKTESGGRIHTSTISVVVLPEIQPKDLEISEKDLKFDYFRASGAGGQHVNKTESAVRITHIPTGIIAVSQATPSQLQNKQTAMEVLRSKLYSKIHEENLEKNSKERLSQIAGSKRSEKIRTYNFLQDRITDHRLGKAENFHISDIFEKNKLQELIDKIKNEN
jgi:peptide chain release factor 1